MDIVLGVSMAPSTVRMVLVGGENADGAIVDQDNFEISANGDTANYAATDQVISAILGTREGAAEGGYHLASTGVTWNDQVEAAALRDALAARKIENVMLVSAFLAAAALAQTVGNATNYARTALLFIEPDTATLAVVDSADGSIADVHRQPLPDDDDEAVAELTKLASAADALEARPDGLFVVGSGVDVALIRPALQAATSLPISAPEESDMALARGAALASANAPLFASSTAALAYAQDPGTGVVDQYAVSPGYLAVPDGSAGVDLGDEALAYSADPDEQAQAYTAAGPDAYVDIADDEEVLDSRMLDFRAAAAEKPSRKPFLTAMSVLTIFVVGVVALVISLAFSIRPSVDQRPNLGQNVVAPTKQAPAPPPPKAQVPAPAPAPPKPAAPPPPAPAPARAPAPAPAPAPPPIPPVLPQLPQILAPPQQGPPLKPWGGDHGGGGWGHGHGGGDGGGHGGGHGGGFGIPGLGGGHGGGFGIPGIGF
ncbi:MAG: DUF7159 family protein [Mycobacterium sp.]